MALSFDDMFYVSYGSNASSMKSPSDILQGLYANESNITATNPFLMPWWQQTMYAVPFCSMFIIAVGGNIIVIWIVLANKRMRTVTNYFLVNLAAADALISLFNTAFNTVFFVAGSWPFGRNYCKFSMFIAPCTMSASVLTFMAIAIDRYIAIMHPLRPRLTAKRVIAVIVTIWELSIVIALPNLIYAETHTWYFGDGSIRTICYLDWPDGVANMHDFIYSIVVMMVNYFLPLLVLGVTYTIVGLHLWKSKSIGENIPRQEESVRSKRKVVKMMIVVVIIFAICWLPQHTYFLLTYTHVQITNNSYIHHVYLAIYWLAMSNSMYNPIIYCWMNARFRRGFQYVFRWCPCITWQRHDNVVRVKGVAMRQSWSVTDSSKLERNGSMMQTMIESLDESSYVPWQASGYQRPQREDRHTMIREKSF